MIVRISTEGQWRVSGGSLDRLNDVDNRLVDAIARGDKDKFKILYPQLFSIVRNEGDPVPEDEIVESDIVLPPPDASFAEVRNLFQGEGLVPD